MQDVPLCPHCSTPLVDAGDIATFSLLKIAHFEGSVWVMYCGNCKKAISANVLPKLVLKKNSKH